MMRSRTGGALLAALLLFGWSLTGLDRAPTDTTLGVVTVAAAQEPDPFVGNAMCVRCHSEVAGAMTAVSHGGGAGSALVDRGCQSCHGPGRLHVQRPEDESRHPTIRRLLVTEQEALCTSCHTAVPPFDATHATAQVTCAGCHVFHQRQAATSTAQAAQPNCLACHAGADGFDELHDYDIEAMRAGTVTCASCHPGAHDR